MRNYNELVEGVAKAIYEQQVQQAKKRIDEKTFDSTEIVSLFARLKNESDTAHVLIVSSFIESAMSDIMKQSMEHIKTKDDIECVFGSNAPLSTFGNRITLAYYLGWIEKNTRDRLNDFRKIRNEFAHRAYKITYADSKIESKFAPLLADLEKITKIIMPIIRSEPTEYRYTDPTEMDNSKRYICSMCVLIYNVVKDLLVLPECVSLRVDPNDLVNYESGPRIISALSKNFSESLLEIMKA